MRVGFGAGKTNTRTRPKPTTGGVFKTHTGLICFADQVKPAPLEFGSSTHESGNFFHS